MPIPAQRNSRAEAVRLKEGLSFKHSPDNETCVMMHQKDGLETLETTTLIDQNTGRVHYLAMAQFKQRVIAREAGDLPQNIIKLVIKDVYDDYLDSMRPAGSL